MEATNLELKIGVKMTETWESKDVLIASTNRSFLQNSALMSLTKKTNVATEAAKTRPKFEND